jgi:hypothetical protein
MGQGTTCVSTKSHAVVWGNPLGRKHKLLSSENLFLRRLLPHQLLRVKGELPAEFRT